MRLDERGGFATIFVRYTLFERELAQPETQQGELKQDAKRRVRVKSRKKKKRSCPALRRFSRVASQDG